MESVYVEEIMTEHVLSVNSKMEIKDVVHLMLRNLVSGMPVIDDNGRVVGIITITDLFSILKDVVAAIDSGEKYDSNIPVENVMTRNVISIFPTATINEAIRISVEKNIHTIPVINESGNLIGILGRRDILNAGFSIM